MKSHSTQSLACYCQVAGDLWHIPISDGSLGCKPRGSSNASPQTWPRYIEKADVEGSLRNWPDWYNFTLPKTGLWCLTQQLSVDGPVFIRL